jgi:hypothetical protein
MSSVTAGRAPKLAGRWWLPWTAPLVLVVFGAGCGDEGHGGADASPWDARADVSVVPSDGATPDAGLDAAADSGADGGAEVPLDGFGDISGACGVLDDTVWGATGSQLFRNAIDFGAATFDVALLSAGGQEVWYDGNLGGSSIHSEIFSYEVLYRCELADLLKTEGEILYLDPGGKKTDLLVSIDARKVGVSVTRAFHFPPGTPFPFADARALLADKCGDILLSADNAAPADAWERSVLHVIAYDADHADVIETAYATLEATVVADTLLVVTVTDGTDDYMY